MTRSLSRPRSSIGTPAWEIAELFPHQGDWTERGYLALQTNRLVEFDNGKIDVLPVPTKRHQLILGFLYDLIRALVSGRGRVLLAGYRVKIPHGRFREPDLVYLTSAQDAQAGEDFTAAAELVLEIVSPDDPSRDYVDKRQDYAAAQIPEYWIVDPAENIVLVLRLENGQYVEHGRFSVGQTAYSHLLTGFSMAVDEILSRGR
jgi:Uma2 family endonuclease